MPSVFSGFFLLCIHQQSKAPKCYVNDIWCANQHLLAVIIFNGGRAPNINYYRNRNSLEESQGMYIKHARLVM